MKTFLYLILTTIISFFYSCTTTSSNKKEVVVAPAVITLFRGIDTIATNDCWNRKPNEILDVKVKRDIKAKKLVSKLNINFLVIPFDIA